MAYRSPKLLTFDVTNTILKFRHSPGYQYCEAAKNFGINNIDEEKLTECFKKQMKLLSAEYPNFGTHHGLSYQKWWYLVIRNSFICAGCTDHQDKFKAITKQLIKDYLTDKCWNLDNNYHTVLSDLKNQGYYLGVISNSDERLKPMLNNFKVLRYMDFVISSQEARCMKPEKRIFDLALLACPPVNDPTEALHIGDDADKDYEGARSAGWNALILTDKPDHEDYKNVQKEHIITNIMELPGILTKLKQI